MYGRIFKTFSYVKDLDYSFLVDSNMTGNGQIELLKITRYNVQPSIAR